MFGWKLAGGLLVYSIFFGTARTLTAKGQLSVESMDLVKDTEGNTVFTITVKNTGNKPATEIKVTLGDEGAQSITDVTADHPFQLGQSAKRRALKSEKRTFNHQRGD
ncbi:MAG: hypothetical protein QMD13_04150 [Candidatus Bathyarchaeia archaeon]|nr:hypothetical protein [Candidatus Bathyarchaeia archaeon]